MKCPCCSDKDYEACCAPYLAGKTLPETAEQLMRSRYTAYTRVDLAYLKKTMAPEGREEFDPKATEEWAKGSKWLGLKILKTKRGTAADDEGIVEFIAMYENGGKRAQHHEISEFTKDESGQWLFVDGHAGEGSPESATKPVVREGTKVGRNDPCPCGSGKKFKKCCEGAAA